MADIQKLIEVMAALRDPESGCPWDQAQDFASVAPYTIEEAYEVADAIGRGNLDDLKDELGDLLFQVVFHARMAEEDGLFDFAAVVAAIVGKLKRRHPHVFGSDDERRAGAQPGSWERLKAAERADADAAAGALDGIPVALPAIQRAQKLGGRAARVGFDWPDASGPRAKVVEELAEFDAAVAGDDAEAAAEELGDLLFSIANLARHRGIDAEAALAAANGKFERRFRAMESMARDAGVGLEGLPLESLEAYWEGAKRRES